MIIHSLNSRCFLEPPQCTWPCGSAWGCSNEPKPIKFLLSRSSGGCDGKKPGTFSLSPAVDSADSHRAQRGAHSLLEVPRESDHILIFLQTVMDCLTYLLCPDHLCPSASWKPPTFGFCVVFWRQSSVDVRGF